MLTVIPRLLNLKKSAMEKKSVWKETGNWTDCGQNILHNKFAKIYDYWSPLSDPTQGLRRGGARSLSFIRFMLHVFEPYLLCNKRSLRKLKGTNWAKEDKRVEKCLWGKLRRTWWGSVREGRKEGRKAGRKGGGKKGILEWPLVLWVRNILRSSKFWHEEGSRRKKWWEKFWTILKMWKYLWHSQGEIPRIIYIQFWNSENTLGLEVADISI